MIQLTQNSPTCAYIGQNLLKWKLRQLKPRQLKPRYVGSRCICTGTPLILACSAELWNYDKKLGLLEEPLKASAGIQKIKICTALLELKTIVGFRNHARVVEGQSRGVHQVAQYQNKDSRTTYSIQIQVSFFPKPLFYQCTLYPYAVLMMLTFLFFMMIAI